MSISKQFFLVNKKTIITRTASFTGDWFSGEFDRFLGFFSFFIVFFLVSFGFGAIRWCFSNNSAGQVDSRIAEDSRRIGSKNVKSMIILRHLVLKKFHCFSWSVFSYFYHQSIVPLLRFLAKRLSISAVFPKAAFLTAQISTKTSLSNVRSSDFCFVLLFPWYCKPSRCRINGTFWCQSGYFWRNAATLSLTTGWQLSLYKARSCELVSGWKDEVFYKHIEKGLAKKTDIERLLRRVSTNCKYFLVYIQ